MNIAITKMSSKGQIVIPSEMRKDFHEGEKFVVYEIEGKLVLEKVDKVDKKLKEDLEFARRTEEAYKEIEKGNFIKMDSKDFLKELKKW